MCRDPPQGGKCEPEERDESGLNLTQSHIFTCLLDANGKVMSQALHLITWRTQPAGLSTASVGCRAADCLVQVCVPACIRDVELRAISSAGYSYLARGRLCLLCAL